MITVKNLTKSYGEKDLFEGLNFVVGNGKKIGLVGKNGCGKSTLFKIIVGFEDTTLGVIEKQNEIIGYVPQEFDFPDELVGVYLESKLSSPTEMYKIETIASQLNFTNFDIYQNLHTLSEGQKMKIKLIEILLEDPTTLLIDEPTNHLDIDGIMWFEEYVKRSPITIVMISHDRSFLNHTVDEIWEIDKQQIFKFVGDYDDYKIGKSNLINKWDQEYTLFIKKKAQLEQLLQNVRKITDGKKRGRAVQAVKKRIDREINENAKEKYVNKTIKDVDFKTAVHADKLMIRFTDVSKSYGDKKVFSNVNFEVRGKEKVWVYGPNGAGKTTIVKMIMKETQLTNGTIKMGDNISVGYFSQTQAALTTENNLLDEFIDKTGCYFATAYNYLKDFLFSKSDLKKKIKFLSPGEKARFAFAIFAYKNYDLLILDEPDNHLDIETKEVIEKSLREYKGTLLLVSHDRYFVEQVGIDKVFNLTEGTLTGLSF